MIASTAIALISCVLAGIPAFLFLRNRSLYLTPAEPGPGLLPQCSVLIPARNEESTIGDAIASVLQSRGAVFEVLVYDDESTDATAEVVGQIARCDDRIQLVRSSPLPAGWCGKQYACHVLSEAAQYRWLFFMDADVRLSEDALTRVIGFMQKSGAALVSGVPAQTTGSFLERLLIPLIHFILLGFLPLERMRSSRDPALAAGCGQLFVAEREAYRRCGGHRAIGACLHDGVNLPRAFRAAGFATDVFDATDVAVCRMYRSNTEVWRGLSRNAHEGLGTPRLIGFATILLFGGQVLPFVLLAWGLFHPLPAVALLLAGAGVLLAYLPRAFALKRFRQSLFGALVHPLGICALLAIQWQAFFRTCLGVAPHWKGRAYLVK